MTWARTGQPGSRAELPGAGAIGQQVRRIASAAAWPTAAGRPVPVWAVVSAGLSPVLIVAGWLAADALQPASYSPLRQTVSVLAGHAGTDRWLMTGALLLVGGCHLVTAAGLTGARPAARVLLIVAGLSSIGIATCPEPAHGSTPQHLAWTALGAVTIALWPVFVARRSAPHPLILSPSGSAVVTAVFAALLGWLIIETQSGADLGLAERLTSAVQISWPFIAALALRRAAPRSRQPELPADLLPRPEEQAITAGAPARQTESA